MEFSTIRNMFLVVAVLASLAQSATVNSKANEEVPKPTPLLPVPRPTQIGGRTFYVETWFQASWYRASQFCRYHGLQLASIHSKSENDALTVLLNNTAFNDLHFWTSGNDIDQTGLYTWYSTGNNLIDFYNFQAKEPNHMLIEGEVEHCIEVVSLKKDGAKWNDVRCSNLRYFICEK